ncbi:glycine cleavage system protein H [Fundicoccus culcitae]|uniref:Glycine cleavage system protein H n=1 Tax=Fundicoccus culcitae TaxID=2969821 RepID=A0ABY5P6R4_9LACT|nr:glycine cleavage system protein H [Fundicoccus culcitae]UUX34065.1 glycine cleavage system protein H [Fundicoccus culcitae]
MRKTINQLWIEKDGDSYTIGMTDDLQFDAGDISYVSIANEGPIEMDETLLNIEASKAAIEVPSPLAGTIFARNSAAEDEPALLSSKNTAEHWIVKMNQVDEATWNQLESDKA